MTTKLRSLFILIGLVLVMTIVPFVPTLMNVSDNEVFAPINDQYYSCGDNRFYFSHVKELQENFFFLQFPVSENIKLESFDTMRASTYRLLYLLGGWIPDTRYGYVLSSSLTVILGAVFLYLMLASLGLNQAWILVTATTTIFFYPAVSQLPKLDFALVHGLFNEKFLNSSGKLVMESMNSNFRYAILSGVMPFVWFFFHYSIKIKNSFSWKSYVVMTLLLVAVQYTYLPITLYLNFYFFLTIVIAAYRKEKSVCIQHLIIGMASVLVFLCIGGYGHIMDFVANFPKVITDSHLEKNTTLSRTEYIFLFMSNLILFLTYFLLRKKRITANTSQFVLINTVIYFFLSVGFALTGKSPTFFRFYDRGFGVIWALLILTQISLILQDSSFLKKHETKFLKFIAITFLILITQSAFRMGKRMNKAGAFKISQDRWRTYEYLNSLPDNQNIFATTFSDIQLLPSYTNQNLVVAGAEFLEEPEASFQNYFSGMKRFTDVNRLTENWISNFEDYETAFKCSPKNKTLTWEKSVEMETFKQLLYDPYIKRFGSILIRENDKLSSSFIDRIRDISNETSRNNKSIEADYILSSPPYKLIDKSNTQEVFRSGEHVIYKVISDNKS